VLSSYSEYFHFLESPVPELHRRNFNHRKMCAEYDGASIFLSEEIKAWMKDKNILHRFGSADNPQIDGEIKKRIKLWKNLKEKLNE
jgi:hypothetical protein